MATYRVWQMEQNTALTLAEHTIAINADDWIDAISEWLDYPKDQFRLVALCEARFFAMDTATFQVYGVNFAR